MKTKLFCIGFHKTGTKTLTRALQILGYHVTGPNGVTDPNIEKNVFAMADELVEQYDAFQDNPWPIIYKELDQKYPDSKFILTLRDSNSWLKSIVNHFGYEETPMRKWIYGEAAGYPKGNEDIYLKRFEDHQREVKEYFKDRPEDLLVMDLTKGDGWEKLCSFLEVDIPNTPFPHVHKGSNRVKTSSLSEKLNNKVKSLVTRVVKVKRK